VPFGEPHEGKPPPEKRSLGPGSSCRRVKGRPTAHSPSPATQLPQRRRAHSFSTRASLSRQPTPKLAAISTWSASSGRSCTLSQLDRASNAPGRSAISSANVRGNSPATAREADASRTSSERRWDFRKSSRAVVVSGNRKAKDRLNVRPGPDFLEGPAIWGPAQGGIEHHDRSFRSSTRTGSRWNDAPSAKVHPRVQRICERHSSKRQQGRVKA